ncbi:putative scytalone dehydratase [Plenodomus tracheiphilus IPT5]|uniref:Scytalone dehydratase n=1 Tax=Plenodomus tracheiphilus IPT5 TaxID=1408161 RepID=A0A6A7AV07_9PLEO|nr:putative scytalone dehydratase [Plenodomus tracheiphilus IPT5]
MPQKSDKRPSPEDVLECQAAAFEWAESFDSKAWDRLSKCLAPTLYVDYRAVMGMSWEAMPAEEFLAMASSPKFLGNARVKTQHFMGQTKWIQTGDGEITGYHQMRVAHQRYKDEELTQVAYKGHAHGKATINYRCIDGEWKFAGLTPDIRWSEDDYAKIFQED